MFTTTNGSHGSRDKTGARENQCSFPVVRTEDVATCTGVQEKLCDHKKETTHSHFPGAKNEVPEDVQVY